MMWFFFIFWQLMTLPGYALIRFERRKPENIRAANKYLIMMQIACAGDHGRRGASGLRRRAGQRSGKPEYDFRDRQREPAADARTPGRPTTPRLRPLPGRLRNQDGHVAVRPGLAADAHPAAPSPVSAMLSGVMIKTGVYGLMRYFLWLVPPAGRRGLSPGRWGLVVAVLGTITLFTGTMQALKQEQSKRLLAFHSIGQIGYILLGAGACMALLPARGPAAAALATLALFGALLHVLNHGLFKALLFLNAGSMLHATGTQDLNRMGGLIRFMPVTALTALVASFSISGVPLFNGFVSKWSIYVAAVLGGVRPLSARLRGVAILTSALTLASFIKFFGVSFLSRTSSLVAARAAARGRLEVGWAMQAPQVFFALCCIASDGALRGVPPPSVGAGRQLRRLRRAPLRRAPVAGGLPGNRGARLRRPVRPAGARHLLGLLFLPPGPWRGWGMRPAGEPALALRLRAEAECNRYARFTSTAN